VPVLSRLRSARWTRVLIMLAVVAVGVGLLSIAPPAPEARAAAPTPRLVAGEWLQPGQFLASPKGNYRLTMQPNGDLVLFVVQCPQPSPFCPTSLWAYWTLGTAGQPGNRLTMQRDGNLVLYSQTGRVVWATMTNRTGNANVLQMQDDGNLVVYSAGRPVWYTGSRFSYAHVAGRQVGDLKSPNGRYWFFAPGNGMEVAYSTAVPWGGSNTKTLWHLDVVDDPRVNEAALGRLMLQPDGNLVWYQPGKHGGQVAVWSSGTQGTGPSTNLVMQDDGNLVLYDLWHRMLWSYRTGRVGR
jgi:hypothetical protein